MKYSLARLSVLVSTILFSSLVFPARSALVEIPDHTKKWQPFKGCEFVPRQYNDGDSFAVKVENNEHVLRLAFVDAPESDVRFPDRNAEQAAYFGVDAAIIPEWGKAATAKTAELLAQPFTVTTRWAKALGSSGKPRYYAVITTAEGKDLGETLLSLGLARIKGLVMKPPTGESVEVYQTKLARIEAEAKQERRGLWAKSGAK